MKHVLGIFLAASMAASPFPAYADDAVVDDALRTTSCEQSIPALPKSDAPASARTIACWGDSLTEGAGASGAEVRVDGERFDVSYLSYPEVLERLTGMTAYNYGVSGATSDEIAFMQGGLQDLDGFDPFESVDLGTMVRGRLHPGDILVLEIGSNGGWDGDYDELIAQYRSMIEHAGVKDYLIIGDTDDPGTSFADVSQRPFPKGTGTGETSWEAALREEFGDHFINMRAFLIERGLETAGLEATAEDDEDASRGCISGQLRADWTHLNSYGYYAQAFAVHERGRELGYWS